MRDTEAVRRRARGALPEDASDTQPIVSGDVVFVCRVRLDNRPQVASRLRISPQDAREMADAALLHGPPALGCRVRATRHRRHGFVAWHVQAARVVAGVNRLGAARLFYSRCGQGLALSDQLPALLAYLGISTTPNVPALAELFDYGSSRETTAYRERAKCTWRTPA